MMKRVCNTRFAMSAMLLAVFLLVTGAGAPVWARENISAGQAGDPNDGNDVASGGSDIRSTAGSAGNATNEVQVRTTVMLVPMTVAGIVIFRVVLVPTTGIVKQ